MICSTQSHGPIYLGENVVSENEYLSAILPVCLFVWYGEDVLVYVTA